jgi:hypothetical protein
VQVALGDPTVSPELATRVTMQLVARELGFDWQPKARRNGRAKVRPAAAAARRRAGAR